MRNEHSRFDEVVIALSHVAELVKHGEYEKATKLLHEILPVADEITDIDEKFASFFQIARAYIMVGRPEKAKEIFESIDEELANLDTIRSKFYRLVIKIERIKYGLAQANEKELESIRNGFKRLYEETHDISIARYYIAFIVLMWAPTYKRYDLDYTIEVLRKTIAELESLDNDPQYAELLTTLAELLVEKGNFDDALELLEEAVRIYLVNPQHFKDTIESIIMFVRQKIPEHYVEFMKRTKLNEFDGESFELSTKEENRK